MNTEIDLAIIGAGAAGLMAGIAAARAGADVRVLESNPMKRLGAKILVSGGSRCNVTNEDVVPARFHGEGAAPFVSRILRSFSPADTHRFFESIGVELKLEPTGKFFPVSDSSRTVLNALLRALEESGAQLCCESPVLDLEFNGEQWILKTPTETVQARAVLIATGGLALPKSGSDGRGYALVRRFGHTLVETTPALTPLLSQSAPHAGMSGLTLPVRLRLFREREAKSHARSGELRRSFLFTHVGYSGPVALNMSRHLARVQPQFPHASVFASWLRMSTKAMKARGGKTFNGRTRAKTYRTRSRDFAESFGGIRRRPIRRRARTTWEV
jgi:predicted Rossmann fold flavoprotein